MKKTLAVLSVSALALMGCDSRDANAQSQVSADVGNADSANMLVVEEGYQVVTPTNNMMPDPGNPGVEVAPAGNGAATDASVSTPGNMQSNGASAQGTVVNETITEAVSPDGVAYEVDQTID